MLIFNPASYWITHPTNNYIGNHAAGSETYGFWMEFPVKPTGLHMSLEKCPHNEPLGTFRDNVSHSNGRYGLRIFPIYNPLLKPCKALDSNVDSLDYNVAMKATLENMLVYKNKERGFITEQIGNLEMTGFVGSDNADSNLEVSRVIPFGTGLYGDSPRFTNSFLIGWTNNPNSVSHHSWGIVSPRSDNFIIDKASFYNFDYAGSGAISTCSRCHISDASTDSGSRTIFLNGLKFDSSVTKRLFMNFPTHPILIDIDGSLGGNLVTYAALPAIMPLNPSWYITANTPYLLNSSHSCSPCVLDTNIADNAIKCPGTKHQLRRIALTDAGNTHAIRIKGITDRPTEADKLFTTNTGTMAYKSHEDPKGWAVPFITGCKYLIGFGSTFVDWDKLELRRNKFYLETDLTTQLVFGYTANRDDYDSKSQNSCYWRLGGLEPIQLLL